MKQTAIFLLLFLIIVAEGFSQDLKGHISDSAGNALIGAHISNESSDTHCHSDLKGDFLLKGYRPGDTILISYIGYQPSLLTDIKAEEYLKIVLQEKSISLSEILIKPDVDAINMIAAIDLQTAPVNSSQDILRKVPGLFISQHAGGGKSEQIFLRGFDLDHGTDIAISVDGLPVNMVSHAHGQGYSDLHFLIPETIENIQFGKGPYYSEYGNFSTAAYVDFTSHRKLDDNIVKIEMGNFNSQRIMTMMEFLDTDHQSGYFATEFISSDGPFESPQNFRRFNLQTHYNFKSKDNDFTVKASHFNSKWNASGQIPVRAVEQGLISTFGAIDDTEGGHTGRTNVSLHHTKFINNNSFLENLIFYSRYNFELYSNFSFFLNDPVNGDQIRQKESREIYGFRSELNHSFSLGDNEAFLKFGAQLRTDIIDDNELSSTIGRTQTARQHAFGDVEESNFSLFASSSFIIDKLNINPGIRYDLLKFNYTDQLASNYNNQSASQGILSPKLNITYNPNQHFQLYFKSGFGFHSNDTRVIVDRSSMHILPKAYGYDLGLLWKPIPKLMINTAFWTLKSEQEFVYVGDEGIVEPSDPSFRQGIDFSIRHQALQWLFWNADITYAHARSGADESHQEYIPLAPPFTFTGGIDFKHPSGIFGGTKFRMLTKRPGNEDNSIALEGYEILDLNIGYAWQNIVLALNIQNLLDSEWKETQFVSTSQLQNETQEVEEIHFTPGTPRNIKFSISYQF